MISSGCAHGRASTALLEPGPGRGLWRAHAFEPVRDDIGARTAANPRFRCGTRQCRPDRESDPFGARSRLNPITDGQLIRANPRFDRRTPQGIGQNWGTICRKSEIAVRNVRRDGMDI